MSKKSSVVWDYYNVDEENDKCFCEYCEKPYKLPKYNDYGRFIGTSTGTLKRHLKSEHEIYIDDDNEFDDDDVITNFFITSNTAFNVLNNMWFKKIMKNKIEPISTTTLKDKIFEKKDFIQKKIFSIFKERKNLSLLIDTWWSPKKNLFWSSWLFS